MEKFYEPYGGTFDDGDFPAVLYKYRNWENKYHKRFINNLEIFLAAPSSFEDEKDCKIPLRYDLLSEKQIMEYALHYSKIGKPNLTRQQHRKESREWVKLKLFKNNQFLSERHKILCEENDFRRGVLSLTAEPCLDTMWNKYAANSEGFCVGYNSRVLFNSVGGGGKVGYYDELPVILPEPSMSFHEKSALLIFSKEKKWDFEKEYRTHQFRLNPDEVKRQVKLPKEAFNCIILGSRMSAEYKIDITNAVKRNIGDIPIYDHSTICYLKIDNL